MAPLPLPQTATAAAATIVTTALTSLYIDAKLDLTKDIRTLRAQSRMRKGWDAALKSGLTSPYYHLERQCTAPENVHRECLWYRNPATGEQTSHTWSDFLDKTHRYANWFLGQGVKKGDLVALFMLNSPDFLFAWAGLWAIGCAPAMINYHLAGAALVHCLGISGAKLVLMDGDAGAMGRMEDVKNHIEERTPGIRFARLGDVRGEIYTSSPVRPGNEHRAGIRGHHASALFYTSGTTGMPKGCPLPMTYSYGHGLSTWAGTSPVTDKINQRYYICMPFYHGTGGINAMWQLQIGTTVCIAPKFSASNFWKDVRDSRATWFAYVGETLRYLMAAPPSPLDKQHSVHSIQGNGLRPDVWTRFKERFGIERIFEFFNSTEGMFAVDNDSRNEWSANAVGHHGFLQRWKYHQYYVPVAVDAETGDIARDQKGWAIRMPYDVGGEMLVKIPFMRPFGGYWNNPKATEAKYVRNVFKKGDCYYRTGDALRRDGDGRWYFLDRLGDTFRWKGENVSTTEVSEVLGRFPGVLEANVYGVQLPGHDGKAGAAAIYLDPALDRSAFNHQEFLRHARTHLPRYAVPLFLRHVDTPSATHNNKQNKVPLKQEGVDPEKVNKTSNSKDKLLWVDSHGRGTTYVPFTKQDWDDLHVGKAKL